MIVVNPQWDCKRMLSVQGRIQVDTLVGVSDDPTASESQNMAPQNRQRWFCLVLIPMVVLLLMATHLVRNPARTPTSDAALQARWKTFRTGSERLQEMEAWIKKGDESVPILTTALVSDDPNLRWHAASALGRIGKRSRTAVPMLIRLLDESIPAVRQEAGFALRSIGCDDPAVVPRLVRRLHFECDPQFRICLMDLFTSFGDKALPDAIALVQSEEQIAKRHGIELLQKIGLRTKEAVTAMRQVLHSDDDLRERAAEALVNLHACNPNDVRRMLQLASTGRLPTAPELAGMSTPQEIPMTVPVGLPNPLVVALFRLVEPAEFVSDVRRRTDADPSQWLSVLNGLGLSEFVDREWSELTPAIVLLVKSKDPALRATALWALNRLDVNSEILAPALREVIVATKPQDAFVSPAAARIMVRVAPDEVPELVAILRDRLRQPQSETRHADVATLCAFGERAREALPELREALLGPQLRNTALAALPGLGPAADPLVPDLLNLMDESQFGLFIPPDFNELRRRVILTLGSIAADRPDVQEALIDVLSERIPRGEAIVALANARIVNDNIIGSIDRLMSISSLQTSTTEVGQAFAKLVFRERLHFATVTRYATAAGDCAGPAWHQGDFLFCGDGLMRAADERSVRQHGDLSPAGTFSRSDGHLLVCDNRTRSLLDLTPDGRVGVLAESCDGQPLRSLNDVTQDADGNIFWTDPEDSSIDNPVGRVFRRRPDGHVDCVADDLAFPSGIEVDPRNQFLYVIESATNKVLRAELESFDYAPHPVSRRFFPVFKLGGQGAAGCAFDAEGRLWVADSHPPGTDCGRIVVLYRSKIKPEHDWEMVGQLNIPAAAVSGVTFGGPNHDELFCTTANPNGAFRSPVGVRGFRGHAGRPLSVLRYLELTHAAN